MNDIRYVDVHAHLNLASFKDDWEEVAKRTSEGGVAYINVGTQIDTSRRAVELAEKLPNVYATIGLHPVHTSASYHDEKEIGGEGKGFRSREETFEPALYKDLALSKKVVAVGECGLDYYRADGTNNDEKKRQFKAFEAQLAFAMEHDLPLMLHCRPSKGTMDAYEDILEILRAHTSPRLRGNVHFFVGTPEIAKEFYELNFTTSFTGVITFTHEYDETIKAAPPHMLHAETDSPYVTPEPHRGKRNEPLYVREVVERIAGIREESEEKLRMQLLKNAKRVFGVAVKL